MQNISVRTELGEQLRKSFVWQTTNDERVRHVQDPILPGAGAWDNPRHMPPLPRLAPFRCIVVPLEYQLENLDEIERLTDEERAGRLVKCLQDLDDQRKDAQ